MSTLENFVELDKLIKKVEKYTFFIDSVDFDSVRVSERRGRCDTIDRVLTGDMKKWIKEGLAKTEHVKSADITYYGGWAFGNALRDVALREMRMELKKYAEQAEKEATECLKVVKNQNNT